MIRNNLAIFGVIGVVKAWSELRRTDDPSAP